MSWMKTALKTDALQTISVIIGCLQSECLKKQKLRFELNIFNGQFQIAASQNKAADNFLLIQIEIIKAERGEDNNESGFCFPVNNRRRQKAR